MRNPLCLIRTIWRSINARAFVMGHEYETDSEPTPKNVHVLRCKTCGATSVAWSWDSLEGKK